MGLFEPGIVIPLKKKRLPMAGKTIISVNLACKFLGLKDYPVPVNENTRLAFQEYTKFEDYYLPLLATINPESNPLAIKTLAKAKWKEVMKARPGDTKSLYFNKVRKNRIRVHVEP